MGSATSCVERASRRCSSAPDKFCIGASLRTSEWTSSVMNVQEHIQGIRGDDLGAIVAAGLDRKLLAARGADAVLKMILVDGFFHADPHPGNVMYLPGNRIAL